jgi:hypothetical protein
MLCALCLRKKKKGHVKGLACEGGGGVGSLLRTGRTLDTDMDIILLILLGLAAVFIRFREGIDGFEVLLTLAKSVELFRIRFVPRLTYESYFLYTRGGFCESLVEAMSANLVR